MSDHNQVPPGQDPDRRQHVDHGGAAGAGLPPHRGWDYASRQQQNPHGGYGQAQQQQGPINALYNAPMVYREQGLDVVQSMTYGFKATFARPGLWIGGFAIVIAAVVVLMMLLAVLGSATQSDMVVGITAGLVATIVCVGCLLVVPHLNMLMVRQVDGEKLGLKEVLSVTRWGQAMLTYILVITITMAVILVLCALLAAGVFGVIGASEGGNSAAGAIGVILIILLYAGIILIAIVVSTLLMTAPYYAVEGRLGAVSSVKAGFADVRRNFWPFVGIMLLWSVLHSVAASLTFGLATILLVPAQYHSMAFAYRQASRAPYPNI